MLERRVGKSAGIWEVRPVPVSNFTPLLGSGEKSGALAPSRLRVGLSLLWFLLPQSSAPLGKVSSIIPCRADSAVHQPGRCSSSPGSQGSSRPPAPVASPGLSRGFRLRGFRPTGPACRAASPRRWACRGPSSSFSGFSQCWLIMSAAQPERKAGPWPETEPRGRRGASGEQAMPVTGRQALSLAALPAAVGGGGEGPVCAQSNPSGCSTSRKYRVAPKCAPQMGNFLLYGFHLNKSNSPSVTPPSKTLRPLKLCRISQVTFSNSLILQEKLWRPRSYGGRFHSLDPNPGLTGGLTEVRDWIQPPSRVSPPLWGRLERGRG